MLGHVLRSSEDTPANVALSYAIDGCLDFKSRVGRHQMNLFNVIKSDLSVRGRTLENNSDLHELRYFAQNRQKWKNLFSYEEGDTD